jgi:hypothetical protein
MANIRIEIERSMLNVVNFGAGEPAVLGHSYLWSADMWRPQIEPSSRRDHLVWVGFPFRCNSSYCV